MPGKRFEIPTEVHAEIIGDFLGSVYGDGVLDNQGLTQLWYHAKASIDAIAYVRIQTVLITAYLKAYAASDDSDANEPWGFLTAAQRRELGLDRD